MSDRAVAFHNNPWQGALYVTGGGGSFVAELLSTPGASATVLEVKVPYAENALHELLGATPEQAASDTTARQLAMAAYQRARSLASDNTELFGLGCTASLATNREKKGTHRAHWAIQTKDKTLGFSATYKADRAKEETRLSDQLWSSLQHLSTGEELPADIDFQIAQPEFDTTRLLDDLPAKICTAQHHGKLIFPGSFNPLHDGHRKMMAVTERITDLAGAYEIAIRNADKPAIDYISLEQRLSSMAEYPVWLTNTPTYAEKAELFPGTTFAIGADTIVRVGELRFYSHRQDLLAEALATFEQADCRFLVFGRSINGGFQILKDLDLPDRLRARCAAVSEDDFRMDISSTALRR